MKLVFLVTRSEILFLLRCLVELFLGHVISCTLCLGRVRRILCFLFWGAELLIYTTKVLLRVRTSRVTRVFFVLCCVLLFCFCFFSIRF